jgi:hypothetical protein
MFFDVYVDHDAGEVLSRQQFVEKVENTFNEILEDTVSYDEYLYEYLEVSGFDTVDCFTMSEGKRTEVKKDFLAWLRDVVEMELRDEKYTKYEVEV